MVLSAPSHASALLIAKGYSIAVQSCRSKEMSGSMAYKLVLARLALLTSRNLQCQTTHAMSCSSAVPYVPHPPLSNTNKPKVNEKYPLAYQTCKRLSDISTLTDFPLVYSMK